MPSSTVRINEETHAKLRDLAAATDESMQDILAKAVEAYRREWILRETNAAYARLRADPAAWADIEAERAVLDGTLMDGLQDDVYPLAWPEVETDGSAGSMPTDGMERE